LVCMIKALQCSELRKHSLVRLNDLLLTQVGGQLNTLTAFPCFNLAISFWLQAPAFRPG